MTVTSKPGTQLLTIGIVTQAMFVVIAILVLSKITQSFDTGLAQAINNTPPGGAISTLMILATNYGREYFWTLVVMIMLLFGDRNTKLFAVELAALFIVGIVSGEVLKILLPRQRPYETLSGIGLLVPSESDSSFPSGHALIVAIGAAFSLARFKSRILGLGLTVEAAIVCYSRVYVGVHYPLDVAAGVLFGVSIVGIGLLLIEQYLGKILKTLTSTAVKILREGPLSL